ncbi:MAG: trigger factor [Chloroflexi bacterium CFX4]|nr:trigger factor [Chloroflexi bacterium CFX4]MDL1922821.1 trigger factor [Chloroflexi bacterium CFX3]
MQVEHLENHTARLTVDVPEARFTAAMQRAAKRIGGKVNIPGFRKGKAPFAVVVSYVGQQAVMDEALEDLGNEIYRESLQEAALEPYGMGSLEDVKTEPSLQLVFSVPKAPEVDLGAYRDVRHDYTAPTVTDEQVQEALESLRDRHAEETDVERPAEMGDVLVVDIQGQVIHQHEHEEDEADEESAEGAAATLSEDDAAAEHDHEDDDDHDHTETFIDEKDFDLLLTTDAKREFMPGFTEKVLGVTTGETRTVSLVYPADYEDKRLAAHTFEITFTVKLVKGRTLPELTDDFAKLATNGEIENVADLTARLRSDLEAKATQEVNEQYSDAVFQKVVEGAQVKYPEAMVEDYIDDILNEVSENLRQRGLTLDILKQVQGKDDEALRADYREMAINRLTRSLVMQTLISAERVNVSAADLDAHIETLLTTLGGSDDSQRDTFRKMLNAENNRRDIGVRLVMDRLKERLVAIGRGENPPIESAGLEMPVADQQISLTGMLAAAEVAEGEAVAEVTESSAPDTASEPTSEPKAEGDA